MDELQQLKHFVKLADAYEDSLEKEKPETKKRKPKTEMSVQTRFSADGPALFMEGKGKLWRQPVDVVDRPSARVLRLRRGSVPRITSKPGGAN